MKSNKSESKKGDGETQEKMKIKPATAVSFITLFHCSLLCFLILET